MIDININESIIHKFINKHGRCIGITPQYKRLFPPVICKDGTFMSVQASASHYCEPQEELDDFQYYQFEVRTDLEDELMYLYKSDIDEIEYKFVDYQVINEIINKHGGIDEDAVEKYIQSS